MRLLRRLNVFGKCFEWQLLRQLLHERAMQGKQCLINRHVGQSSVRPSSRHVMELAGGGNQL